MNGRRSAWLAARARNTARQTRFIVACAATAVLATLAVLVWIPRDADQQLRERLANVRAAPDSMPIIHRLDSLRVLRSARIDSASRTRADATARGQATDSMVGLVPQPIATDSLTDALLSAIARAHAVPLPDSYRALAAVTLLRGDARARVLLDSIDRVDREREAHAALGGPGAQYAALTARLSDLGRALLSLAERRAALAVGAADSAGSVAPQSGVRIEDSVARATADSVVRAVREELTRRMALDESLLTAVRVRHGQVRAERSVLEQRLRVSMPPLAMLLAALTVGVAGGFAIALLRELRRPTVGDASEVERITHASVLLHAPDTPSALASHRAPRERPGVPAIIDRESDTFVLLHLGLTGVGDVVREVNVQSDDASIACAVALGIAAAAARESRAALVTDAALGASRATTSAATGQPTVLARALRNSLRALASVSSGHADAAVQTVTLDRDRRIDVLLASARAPEWRELQDRYDLIVHINEAAGEVTSENPAMRDVILCARQGASPLAWLARATHHARRRDQRIRAVVLWSRAKPKV
jgi:hypothetical protein